MYSTDYTAVFKTFLKRHPEYQGDKVKCIICGSHFDHFVPINFGPKRFANRYVWCPICFSSERHRLLWPYLISNLKKNSKVLHFAPEMPIAKYIENLTSEYYMCDISPETYPDLNVKKTDITNIPFEDNSFDFILCNHVLEHIIDDKKAISELSRVLKKESGKLLVSVPLGDKLIENYSFTEEERLEYCYQEDHVRLYDLDTFVTRLKEYGNFNCEIHSTEDYPKDYAYEHGLLPKYDDDIKVKDGLFIHAKDAFVVCTKK